LKKFSLLQKNLKFLRLTKEYSIKKLADALGGVHRATYYSWETGGAQPNIQMILRLAHELDVSVDQLLKKDLKTERKKTGSNNDSGIYEVELVPYKVAAGYSASYSDPEWIGENLSKIIIPFKPPIGEVRAFPIFGDSMEPKVSDGSFVIGVRIENPKRQLKEGKDYLIVTRDNGIMYKIFFKMKDGAELRSLNYKKHPPIRIKREDIIQVWQFFCALDIGKLY
jgi:transcriptional regulator with XRE-family HTH domain